MTPPLIRFSQDLKAVLRMVEDPNIDDESRVAAAGALLNVFSSRGVIPGVRGVLRYLGDVLLMRLMLRSVRERSPEAFEKHAQAAPEMLEPLSDELEAMQAYLEERVSVFEKAVEKFPSLNHRGHEAAACIEDAESSTWLYDAVHEALIDQIDFDEEDVTRELKQVDRILAPLASRVGR
ncbi:MAG: hypothetical protein ACN4G0_12445 [Polyangiales bacterium]